LQPSAQTLVSFAALFFIFNILIAKIHMPTLNNQSKLRVVKIIHTIIWLFFNVVIFYMLYAVIIDKIDKWLWIGYALFILEGLVLLFFKFFCPLTIIARKYSDSTKHNFDIYLPEWLARYNKIIYTGILIIIIAITAFRIIQ
jgi:hypothetical protein